PSCRGRFAQASSLRRVGRQCLPNPGSQVIRESSHAGITGDSRTQEKTYVSAYGLGPGGAEGGWGAVSRGWLEAGRGAGRAMRLGLSQRATRPALRANPPGPSPAAGGRAHRRLEMCEFGARASGRPERGRGTVTVMAPFSFILLAKAVLDDQRVPPSSAGVRNRRSGSGKMRTEDRSPRFEDLDAWSSLEAVHAMFEGQLSAVAAVRAALS